MTSGVGGWRGVGVVVLDKRVLKIKYMVMMIVNIYEAKAKLSEYLDLAARGERVVICKRNRPVAELRAVDAARTDPRPIGLARGRVSVPDAFFEPLPDDVLDAFDGGARRYGVLQVAESPDSAGYGTPPARKTRPTRPTRPAGKTPPAGQAPLAGGTPVAGRTPLAGQTRPTRRGRAV